jgi:hypothetical protein
MRTPERDGRLEAALRLRPIDLRRLDRDDRRRDALEHRRERFGAGLRVGDSRGEEAKQQQRGATHHPG